MTSRAVEFEQSDSILREKRLAIGYNGFSHRRSQLFKNDLMATGKRSKETNSNFIARI